MNPLSADDEEFLALAHKELFTIVVGDVMDKRNRRRQFLPPQFPCWSMIAIGRAFGIR